MKLALVLNACSGTYKKQAEAFYVYIENQIPAGFDLFSIVIYTKQIDRRELVRQIPTAAAHLIEVDRYQPENILAALSELHQKQAADVYLFAGDYAGSELSVRLAQRLGGSSLSAVEHIKFESKRLICEKSVYSNHLKGHFELTKFPCCISLKKGAADPIPVPASEHELSESAARECADFILESSFTPQESAADLDSAGFVLAAGQGIGSAQALQELEQAAEQLGAELGVSRPVAMNAWAPMERMVGVSGTLVKADLCLVAAASGAAAFMAGIEDSSFIASINLDRQAPIVSRSDVAVIDDYRAVIDHLVKLISDDRQSGS